MNLKILILPGDGIGNEVTRAATDVLTAVAKKFGHTLELSHGLLLERTILVPPSVLKNTDTLDLFLNRGEDTVVSPWKSNKEVELVRINGRNQINQAVFSAKEFVTKFMARNQNAPAIIGPW